MTQAPPNAFLRSTMQHPCQLLVVAVWVLAWDRMQTLILLLCSMFCCCWLGLLFKLAVKYTSSSCLLDSVNVWLLWNHMSWLLLVSARECWQRIMIVLYIFQMQCCPELKWGILYAALCSYPSSASSQLLWWEREVVTCSKCSLSTVA